MPSLKAKIQHQQLLIQVIIHSPQLEQDKKQKGHKPFTALALIDTGAQRTCVSQRVVSTLELAPESKVHMKSATESVEVNEYVLGLHIPIERMTPAGPELALFGSPHSLVIEFNASDTFDVIIGMDMLIHCNIFIGHGEFSLSF